MAKGITKRQEGADLSTKNGQPIHLHIPGDAPIHLHVNNDTNIPRIMSDATSKIPLKLDSNTVTYQAPWVPPPAKTSLGRPITDPISSNRRVKLKPAHSAEAIHEQLTAEREVIQKFSQFSNKKTLLNSVNEDTAHLVNIISPKQIPSKLQSKDLDSKNLSEKLPDHFKSTTKFKQTKLFDADNVLIDKSDNTLWTLDVLDDWIKDLDNSVFHITKAARNIADCIEEVAYEGRRINSHDMSRVIQPRDELLLHCEIAGRAGRELCRWASSVKQHQDGILSQSLEQAKSHELMLNLEINRLKEKIDKINIDLEMAKRELSEQQNESLKYNTIHESMESVKAHLQRELRQRDSECSRLSVQVKNLETRLVEQQTQAQVRLEAAESNLVKMRETKEALKRAARSQKHRADQAEQRIVEISQELGQKEAIIANFYKTIEMSNQTSGGRSQERKLNDVGTMHNGIIFDANGKFYTNKNDFLFGSNENQLKDENEHLREVADKCEQRLHMAENELEELRTNLSHCEALLSDYHGDAASQADRLHKLNERLKKTEADRERSQMQLDDVEKRLLEAEARNRILENTIESYKTMKYLNEQPNSLDFNKKLENKESNYEEVSIKTIKKEQSDGDHETYMKSEQIGKLHTINNNPNKVQNNELIDELKRELIESRNEREQIEHRYEIRMTDLRAQLNQADATNRSLQAYLTFLKRSYASVFQSDMIPVFNPNNIVITDTTTNIGTTTTTTNNNHNTGKTDINNDSLLNLGKQINGNNKINENLKIGEPSTRQLHITP